MCHASGARRNRQYPFRHCTVQVRRHQLLSCICQLLTVAVQPISQSDMSQLSVAENIINAPECEYIWSQSVHRQSAVNDYRTIPVRVFVCVKTVASRHRCLAARKWRVHRRIGARHRPLTRPPAGAVLSRILQALTAGPGAETAGPGTEIRGPGAVARGPGAETRGPGAVTRGPGAETRGPGGGSRDCRSGSRDWRSGSSD